MNRRAARWLAPILVALAATFASVTAAGGVAAAYTVSVAHVGATSPEPPPITANDFLPEDRNLSDCVGVLEKPGCGSKERGGPMMTLVFALVIGSMGLIFWRISVGVRKNRAELERSTPGRDT